MSSRGNNEEAPPPMSSRLLGSNLGPELQRSGGSFVQWLPPISSQEHALPETQQDNGGNGISLFPHAYMHESKKITDSNKESQDTLTDLRLSLRGPNEQQRQTVGQGTFEKQNIFQQRSHNENKGFNDTSVFEKAMFE